MPSRYRIEPLGVQHDRAAFACGIAPLDLYLKTQAKQDLQRRLAAIFVMTDDGKTIAGFYTLSAHTIFALELPEQQAKKLPRFPIPVTLLGRMAIRSDLQGKGLGELLLMHALQGAMLGSAQVASWAVIVDTKAGARDFYLRNGFVPLPAQPDRLFLTMETIKMVLESA